MDTLQLCINTACLEDDGQMAAQKRWTSHLIL